MKATINGSPAFIVNNDGGRNLAAEFNGEFPIHPAEWWAATTKAERAMLGRDAGVYCFPTTELVHWLGMFIGDRTALEIGAGAGVLCKALGIPGTDSFLQNTPEVATLYAATGQRTVYGAHVEQLDANEAAERYKPDVIVGTWITHRYNTAEHWRGGNVYGPDLRALLDHCQHLVLVLNEVVHGASPLLQIPHHTVFAPWLYSRAFNGSREFIGIWEGHRRPSRPVDPGYLAHGAPRE